jgi:hypothetical protein
MKNIHEYARMVFTTVLVASVTSACGGKFNPDADANEDALTPPGENLNSSSAALVGATCGTLLGLRCDAGEYCDFPRDTRCGSADQSGTCRARPVVCPLIYSPVCACDGRDYSNACEAARAGVSVAKLGRCDGTSACPKGSRECRMCGISPVVDPPIELPRPICPVRCVPQDAPCPPVP